MQLTSRLERLERRIPTLEQICSTICQPGVSLGVMYEGQTIFTHNIGYRDVETKAKPDENTLYCIGSLTKAFTAASLGILVDEKKVTWATTISSLYPELANEADPVIASRATLTDILSHRSGLANLDTLWQGIHNQILIDKGDAVKAVNSLPTACEFRAGFVYNNLLYSLAGNIIERFAGEDVDTWSSFMKTRIWEPLGMKRTTASARDWNSDENVATPYVTLTNGEPFKINPPAASDNTLIGSAGSIRSSVRELLIWSRAIMEAYTTEVRGSPLPLLFETRRTNPLREMKALFGAASIVDGRAPDLETYGFGWFRHSLPARIGVLSANHFVRNDIPALGISSGPLTTFSHGGSIAGYVSSIALFPESKSAVVVLANSNALGDAADWVSQDLIQVLFELTPEVDMVLEAEKTAKIYKEWFKRDLLEQWATNRKKGTCPGPAADYEGLYCLTSYAFTFRVWTDPDKPRQLKLTFNNIPSQTHNLTHYHHDVWSFLPETYDEFLRIGYLAWTQWTEFLIEFDRGTAGTVSGARWSAEGRLLQFKKKET
ncbi:hypothetical protein GP486_001611 [Trichoglossum hirsutum]|uniref:Beta-lactamase-related domain-containing protein n=1 Tax=Trichoglossum hirsutum TaxID=265104 RepID=A0A9P8LGD3_9PEZI|nr:hypothetical protein GP486_001611 [Trichoglossum hirsutum]